MKRVTLALTVVCVSLAGAGCRKKPLPPGVIVADRQVALAEMAPKDVVVSVNGQALTRKALDDTLDLYVTLYELKRSSASKQAIDMYRSYRAKKAMPEYIMKQLALQEGKRQGVLLSPEELAKAERAVWRSVAPSKTGDDFAAVLGPKTALFKKHVADDEYVKATRKTVFAGRLAVTDEEVDMTVKKREDWNKNAVYAESNRVVMARGEEIVRELRAGADFAEMAAKVSQHQPEEGVEWGEFTYADIEDKKLREEAFKLPVGAVSDPIDTPDGLIIIRVLGRAEGAETDSPIAVQVASVKLAKILLLMYNPYPEHSRAEIRAMMERERVAAVQGEWMPKLYEAARIEYPNGTNFWPKAKGAAKGAGVKGGSMF